MGPGTWCSLSHYWSGSHCCSLCHTSLWYITPLRSGSVSEWQELHASPEEISCPPGSSRHRRRTSLEPGASQDSATGTPEGPGARLTFIKAQTPAESPQNVPQGHLMLLRSQSQVLDKRGLWEGHVDDTTLYFSPGQLDGAHLWGTPPALHILKLCCGLRKDACHL